MSAADFFRRSALGPITVGLSLAGLLVASTGVAGSNRAESSANGAVAFVRGQDVYLIDPGGRPARKLTRLPSGPKRPESEGFLQPAWSADGKRIAVTYSSNDPHEYDEIDVMRANGTSRHVVVDGAGNAYSDTYPTEPTWSPDGRLLAYRAGESCTKLFIVTVATRRAHPVSPGTACPLTNIQRDTEPTWSPNGSEIAFVRSTLDGEGLLYAINPDGTALRRLTRSQAKHPDWSPDGSLIAFDDGHLTVVIKASGKAAPVLRVSGTDPTWSPDGSKILVVRGRDLWVIGADGTNQRLLARKASQPDWQPLP